MKRPFAKLISLFTIASFLISCGQGGSGGGGSHSLEPEVVSNKFIVKNSRTEYSLVIPKNANKNEKAAAQTLTTYLSKSSGAKFVTLSDSEVVSGMHYISLGKTSLFAEEFKDVSMSKLDGKFSSYFISTKDENIYIYSNPHERGEGTIFGAYDLLHYLVGYEYYAADEVYTEIKENINLLNFKNFFIEPTFDGRSIGTKHLNRNQEICDHLRIINQYNGTEWVSQTYGHSQVTTYVRPQDIYDGDKLYKSHPDWFSNPAAEKADTTNNQLCWTAGPELEHYVFEKMKAFIKENPDSRYLMFGQEDNPNYFCKCDRCKHAMEEYGVNYAGLQIIFMNHVIELTNNWLKEEFPERKINYVVFAYYGTQTAPVVQKGNTWVAANKHVVPHEDLYFLYAPIKANFAVPLDNERFNNNTYIELKQWYALAGEKLMVYFYDTNFSYYLSNFYNFGTVKAMYKAAREQGVTYMYTQGATDTNTSCFSDMREYVESKLMWNINLDYEDLVKDFMKHYYREACDELYEYYQTVRDRLVAYHVQDNNGGGIHADLVNTDIYPSSVLRYFTQLFKQAMEKIDFHQDSDPDLYNTLKARIMREYLSVIYLKITLIRGEISKEEMAEMKEIFKTYTGYFDITRASEGGNTFDYDVMFS